MKIKQFPRKNQTKTGSDVTASAESNGQKVPPPDYGLDFSNHQDEAVQLFAGKEQNDPAASSEAKPGDLPADLKSGVESLSGYSMDDVQVHYNSSEPAKLQAKAYTQGTEIHLAPGQEQFLGHEAWHVVQQKQGRVQPTGRFNGSPINEDVSLEQEAENMGTKLQQNSITTQNGSKAAHSGLSPKATSTSGPIQMAGHKGVMIFGNQGKLFKRVEENEAQQFQRIFSMQEAEEEAGHQDFTKGAFPKIYRVVPGGHFKEQAISNSVFQEYGGGDKVRTWLSKFEPGDYAVEMESLGGDQIDILDFKIGKATADYHELLANYKKYDEDDPNKAEENRRKNEETAAKKVKKMSKIDSTTETGTLGLRDSDASKGINRSNFIRIVRKQFVPTLTDIIRRIARDETMGLAFYHDDSQAITDLKNIHEYIANANTVYIASSLVMRWNNDRNKKHLDRVVLIDLAHPVDESMESFEAVQAGMLLGIANLIAILQGQETISIRHNTRN